jgi:hypothetical protein
VLCVYRPSVTVAAGILQRAGMILYPRGNCDHKSPKLFSIGVPDRHNRWRVSKPKRRVIEDNITILDRDALEAATCVPGGVDSRQCVNRASLVPLTRDDLIALILTQHAQIEARAR